GNAIVGAKFDYTVIGQSGSMMMVAVSGTAVQLT
ncbi:MAG: heavy metal-binding domain-containing protein, partial [Hyphomonas sp.]